MASDAVAQPFDPGEAPDPVRCLTPAPGTGDELETFVDDRLADRGAVHDVDHLLLLGRAADADPVLEGQLGQDRAAQRVSVHRGLGLQGPLAVPQRQQHQLLMKR